MYEKVYLKLFKTKWCTWKLAKRTKIENIKTHAQALKNAHIYVHTQHIHTHTHMQTNTNKQCKNTQTYNYTKYKCIYGSIKNIICCSSINSYNVGSMVL